MSAPRILVLAKAPVAGLVKTRLGAHVGLAEAAAVAAAALLDTLRACVEAVGPARCHLALAGDLAGAVRGDELVRAVDGWTVRAQRGPDFATRLVNAHLDLAPGVGPVVQIGMDTPQVTPGLLTGAAEATGEYDAVLGPAEDGGWWVLALDDPRHAAALAGVEMSTPHTHDHTRLALEGRGLRVGATATLRDVDTMADADAVSAGLPGGHFARAWSTLREAGA